jgi:uncharacterized protein with GYD domain
MNTFIMFGKYSSEAIQGMSPDRTKEALNLIKKYGGEIQAMYALLGEIDLVFIFTFPGIEQAMKASIALSKMTGIAFTTAPAVSVGEFDKMMLDLK